MLAMTDIRQFLTDKFIEWQQIQRSRKTLDDYAEYIGVSRPLLSMWMSGNKSPGPKNKVRLIELYGDEALQAFGDDPDLYIVQQNWDDLTPEERRKFSQQIMEKAQKNDTQRTHQKRTTRASD